MILTKAVITLRETVADLIARHLVCYSEQDCKSILAGLNDLTDLEVYIDRNNTKVDIDTFQRNLSKINEKELRRRKEGVYYTPKDVTEYIVANTYLNYIFHENSQVYPVNKCLQIIKEHACIDILNAKVFDPTCGTAEFLLSAINIKLRIVNNFRDDVLFSITSSIYGNDIAQESILLSKIRIFFAVVSLLTDKTKSRKLAKIIQKNFTTGDYVINSDILPRYNIVIGNPPYVEYGSLDKKPKTNYGNTYADVLQNSIDSIKTNGSIGFVIPISYVSTPRMKRIREYSFAKLSKMFVLNFADRPDCLFDGVHQKLTILFGLKGSPKCSVYSSSYYHWYNNERDELLNNARLLQVETNANYIPKIGDNFEQSIFKKILKTEGETLANIAKKEGNTGSVYLNMRGCFWMKAFSFNPGSNEYKQFKCPANMQPYIIALLNSNLFFLYWTIVSDCWHITGKELSEFVIPTTNVDWDAFRSISNRLEQKLEETKKYIGSKQTAYEYKHKDCKKEIDDIDDVIQNLYQLSDEEVVYLRNYKTRYRTSNG